MLNLTLAKIYIHTVHRLEPKFKKSYLMNKFIVYQSNYCSNHNKYMPGKRTFFLINPKIYPI